MTDHRGEQSTPSLDRLSSIGADGSRRAIHPAAVHGVFQRIKNWIWTALIGIYLVLPWIQIGGHLRPF